MQQLQIDKEIRSLKKDQLIYTTQLRRSKMYLENLIILKSTGRNNTSVKRSIKFFETNLDTYQAIVKLNGDKIQQLRQIKSDYIKQNMQNISTLIGEAKNGFVRMSDVIEKNNETNLSKFSDTFLNSIGKNSFKKYMFGEYSLLNYGFSSIHITEIKDKEYKNYELISLGDERNNEIIEFIKRRINDEVVKGYFYSNIGNFFIDTSGQKVLKIDDINKVTGEVKSYKITIL